MNDEERARLLVEGMKSSMPMTPEAEEHLQSVFAQAIGKARDGNLSEDEVRRLIKDVQTSKPAKTATKAVRVYSVERGDFWRGQCAVCGWHSRDLPFQTRAEAEHVVDLHKVLCKGPR